MSNEIKRATGLLVIEVVNSNPNGDPDRESDPRQRPDGRGEISPVSFKRKLRDLLDDHDAPFFQALPEKFRMNAERYFILEHRGRERKEITKEMGKDPAHFMESLTDNIAYACSFIQDHFEGIQVSKPEGTYMLFADCTKWCQEHGKTIEEVEQAAWDVGVALQDGRMFHGPCHLRINLALPLSRIQEAFERLDRYVFHTH